MIEPARKQSEARPVQAAQAAEEQGLLKQFLVGSDVVAMPLAANDPLPTRSVRAVPREGEAALIRSPSWLHVRWRIGADGGWWD